MLMATASHQLSLRIEPLSDSYLPWGKDIKSPICGMELLRLGPSWKKVLLWNTDFMLVPQAWICSGLRGFVVCLSLKEKNKLAVK